MTMISIEFGRSFRDAVEASVGETHAANWIEPDGRIAAVRRVLRTATGFNKHGSQNTSSLLFEFAASGQMSQLMGWRNMDSMLVMDALSDEVPRSAVIVRAQRRVLGGVPFGLRRELYLAEPDGDYERQPRTIREEIYGRKLVLEAGSTVTMFTRIPGIETHLGYARGDLSLKREFDVVADAVRFRG